ncbi:hypothetical protein NPIL_114571 [Nephila pilipes]|uniref:Uncharacterized protein n=1 Tax=Nephila pilipes TaxID=299642 RepID=A0A8X6TR50_NEPPI|nr:hypothetical protein NPIL_114571 [Nephila pilipes]
MTLKQGRDLTGDGEEEDRWIDWLTAHRTDDVDIKSCDILDPSDDRPIQTLPSDVISCALAQTRILFLPEGRFRNLLNASLQQLSVEVNLLHVNKAIKYSHFTRPHPAINETLYLI